MNPEIEFESDYRAKLLLQTFTQPYFLENADSVRVWREVWLGALKSWHSPYKALIDCSQLKVSDDAEVEKALATMFKLLSGFFLKKAVGYGFDSEMGHKALPFIVEPDRDTACKTLGVREAQTRKAGDSLRSQLQLENHFRQHVVELSCLSKVDIKTSDDLAVFKSKIVNNLMQWHSKWSLLIDCASLSIDPAVHQDFALLERFLKGFFLLKIIGYNPSAGKESYPFPVYRSRHKAAAQLEQVGLFSGEDANCTGRKS